MKNSQDMERRNLLAQRKRNETFKAQIAALRLRVAALERAIRVVMGRVR